MCNRYCSSCLQPGHQLPTHRDCPNNRRNRTNPTTVFPGNDINLTNTTSTSSAVRTTRTCICGSTTHQRTNHRNCPNNPRNMNTVLTMPATPALLPINTESTSTALPPINTESASTAVPIELTCICGSTTHYHPSHPDCLFHDAFADQCICGSTTHMTTDNADCPMNPLNTNISAAFTFTDTPLTSSAAPTTPTVHQDRLIICVDCLRGGHYNNLNPVCPDHSNAIPTCRCGSTTHRRTNHRDCPLRHTEIGRAHV